MQAEYEKRFNIEMEAYRKVPEDELKAKDIKPPIPVKIRSEVTREFWLRESAEFQEQIEKEAADAHQRELDEWEALKTQPKKAEDFHR